MGFDSLLGARTSLAMLAGFESAAVENILMENGENFFLHLAYDVGTSKDFRILENTLNLVLEVLKEWTNHVSFPLSKSHQKALLVRVLDNNVMLEKVDDCLTVLCFTMADESGEQQSLLMVCLYWSLDQT